MVVYLLLHALRQCLMGFARQLVALYNVILLILGFILFGMVAKIEAGPWKDFIYDYALIRAIVLIIASFMMVLGMCGVCAACTRRICFILPYVFLTCGLLSAEVIVASMINDFNSDISAASNALRDKGSAHFNSGEQLQQVARQWLNTWQENGSVWFKIQDSRFKMRCLEER